MKVDISIPNPIFEAAKQLAQKHGMSLSEFYTAALAAYVAVYQDDDVTEKLNQVYETEPSTLEPELVALTALLSEPALAEDWQRPEEDAAWSHLQPAQSS